MAAYKQSPVTKEDQIRQRAYWLSLIVSAGILALKFWAYKITNS
jgi:divalent metal cation (Fe/Co/Zn/Cd) transporter